MTRQQYILCAATIRHDAEKIVTKKLPNLKVVKTNLLHHIPSGIIQKFVEDWAHRESGRTRIRRLPCSAGEQGRTRTHPLLLIPLQILAQRIDEAVRKKRSLEVGARYRSARADGGAEGHGS
eukprot:764987-Hanusia_phi.AAC.2